MKQLCYCEKISDFQLFSADKIDAKHLFILLICKVDVLSMQPAVKYPSLMHFIQAGSYLNENV